MANMSCPDVQLQVILLGFIAPMHIPEELKTHFEFHSPYCKGCLCTLSYRYTLAH